MVFRNEGFLAVVLKPRDSSIGSSKKVEDWLPLTAGDNRCTSSDTIRRGDTLGRRKGFRLGWVNKLIRLGLKMTLGSIAFNNNIQPQNYSVFTVVFVAASFRSSPRAILVRLLLRLLAPLLISILVYFPLSHLN